MVVVVEPLSELPKEEVYVAQESIVVWGASCFFGVGQIVPIGLYTSMKSLLSSHAMCTIAKVEAAFKGETNEADFANDANEKVIRLEN